MKKQLILFCLLILPFCAFSQIKVSGSVVDNKNKPIAGAALSLNNGMRFIPADQKGAFNFNIVKPQELVLIVSSLGYITQADTFQVSGDTTIVIVLQPSLYLIDAVTVSSIRAEKSTGIAYSNISKSEIEEMNTAKDLPFILQNTPGAVVTSDAGNGVGYTGIRIRGTDASRINVTINGIPLNDAESQQVYWVDLPDIAASTDNIQIQRGVGTSSNGASAFGGTINLQTATAEDKPFASTYNAFGSFNTIRNSFSAGTGWINNKWNFEGRVSRIQSDGYIDRASSDLKSGFLTGGYHGKKDLIKFTMLTGREITYQSWLGVPEYALDTNRTLNLYTYDNQVDNYGQDHYQLFWSHDAGHQLTLNTALHYTKGKGYYEEYKEDQSFSEYNMQDVVIGADTITTTDLVRRKWLDNDFYGGTFSLLYEPEQKFQFILGGAANRYEGDHFGKVIWAALSQNNIPDYEYYNNTATKTDYNIYLKGSEQLTPKLKIFADFQVRAIQYDFTGADANGVPVPEDDNLVFFNPKAGINYQLNESLAFYLYTGIAHKEPSRDDYVDNPKQSRPESETLTDYEGGVQFLKGKIKAGMNLYYMQYDDQLAVTGKLNDVGSPVRTNIPESYRAGIELESQYVVSDKLRLMANAVFSKNKIKQYNETVYNYDDGSVIIQTFENTDLAFSPEITAMAGAEYFPVKNLNAGITGRYVGTQYMDNTSNSERSLDPYFVADAHLTYNFNIRGLKKLSVSLWGYNLLNNLYESNGYTYSYIYGGSLITENFYYPQAGINYMLQLSLKF